MIQKLKYIKKPKELQKVLNSFYYNPESIIVDKDLVDYLIIDGFKVKPTEHLESFRRIPGWIIDVRPTDVAVDIGACIGGITLPLAKKAKEVHSFEPLYYNELENNIKLNNITNIKTYKNALYKTLEEKLTIRFGSKEETVKTLDWKALVKLIPSINFLKVDIEGAEWEALEPDYLIGIERIRIEFHIRKLNIKKDSNKLMDWIKYLHTHKYLVNCYPYKENILSPIDKTIYLIATRS